MGTRTQFRVDEETLNLAPLMAKSQAQTLSDAYRGLTENLTEK